MSTSILEIRNLTKRIGNKTIIDNVSFEIPKGEVFGFLGPNGAGKTTTIRMMVGLMSITEGDVLIDGHSIITDFERAIVKVGAIVENPEMYKFLSGYDNLIHFARMVPGITKERIDEVIQLVGLANRIRDKVKTYSLGMRQRLGVAQALLHKPSLLILDEPTNGLDPAGIRELRDYLHTLTREEGISVLVSSHLLSEMQLMCDRVAIIQEGKLIDVQSIKDIMNEETSSSVVFELDDIELALETLASQQSARLKRVDGGVECWLDKEQIAVINEILVKAGVKIYGIKKITPSLEEKFLQVTGSDQIA
ncbi:ABC-2 type transport system ATP-binding protein [Aneurinibacillus soli]|uniref:Putative ABC transporter ATP-binding protein YxlF n=1 Tax=Aneurinibacillus soli TaxID=1500254 RepID=A0A0U5BJE9_9BACL|nr:ABC transporter ATP-binding protein [Aneurinibacillus soli]PYE64369.1 ABC-2 type transport system ATP-binding protein [Aneurinibacillus soli]BAU28318.1 putative ABC transporter ATP-binding protein YxlF [Aneurinibacillus soli]